MIHRDYCDKSTSYVKKMHRFSDNVDSLVQFIQSVEAAGGGDAPECYEHVLKTLYDDFNPDWRVGA